MTGVDDWHINADEPIVLDYNTEFKTAGQITSFYDSSAFRSSDHDPVMIGLDLSAPAVAPTATVGGLVAGSQPCNFVAEIDSGS